MYGVQNSLSISVYHGRINIYWDMGLQKHMTLKRIQLLKQPNKWQILKWFVFVYRYALKSKQL